MCRLISGRAGAAPAEDSGGFGHSPSFETNKRSSEKRPGGRHTNCLLRIRAPSRPSPIVGHTSVPHSQPHLAPPDTPRDFRGRLEMRGKPGVPPPWGTVCISWGYLTVPPTGWLRTTGILTQVWRLEVRTSWRRQENLSPAPLLGEGTAWGCSRERKGCRLGPCLKGVYLLSKGRDWGAVAGGSP